MSLWPTSRLSRGFVIATALLLAVYAWSAEWSIVWYAPRDISLDIGRGTACIAWFDGSSLRGVRVRRNPGLKLWFVVRGWTDARFVRVPLWVFLPPLVAAAWMTGRKRVAPVRCAACGYDLCGLPPGAACPECGRAGP